MNQVKILLLVIYIALFSLGIIDSGRGPSYPFILSEFQIGPKFGSLFFVLTSFTGLMVNFSIFSWLPKIGLMKTLHVSLIITSIASLLIGLSGHFIQNDSAIAISLLLFGSLLLGPGAAGLSISMNLIIPKIVAPELRRKSLSGLHFFYGLSSLLAPLFMLIVENGLGGWKNYFLLFSLPPFLIYLISSYNIPDNITVGYKNNPIEPPKLPFRLRFIFGLSLACYTASEVLFSTRLPLLLQEAHHYSSEKAKFALILFFLGLLIGRLLFALINTTIKSFHLLLFSLLATLLLYLPSFQICPLFFSFCGLSMSFFYPCYISWLSEIFVLKIEYMISFTLICVGFLLVSMHWLFGLMTSVVGIHNAFYLAPFFTIMSLVFLIMSNKIAKNSAD